MVKVLFGKELPNSIVNIDVYFDNTYEPDWFEDELVKQIVRDIDQSEIEGCVLKSPFLGDVAIEHISGGAKAVITLLKNERLSFPINLIVCGENCEKWLAYVFEHKDVTVCTTGLHLAFSGYNIDGFCLNDGKRFRNWETKMDEFLYVYNE